MVICAICCRNFFQYREDIFYPHSFLIKSVFSWRLMVSVMSMCLLVMFGPQNRIVAILKIFNITSLIIFMLVIVYIYSTRGRHERCVLLFVQIRHFTQRTFFSKTGLAMLSESVAIADSITSSSVFDPWSLVGTACAGQVVNDLCACWNWFVLRLRTAKRTSVRCYHGGTSGSQTTSRPGVRISDEVEERRVDYVPVVSSALGSPGPSKIRSLPSKRKRIISRSPVKLPQKFEISSPPAPFQKCSLVEDPSFASALIAEASHGKSRRSGQGRRAAPVFQVGFRKRQCAVFHYSLHSPFFFLVELPRLLY